MILENNTSLYENATTLPKNNGFEFVEISHKITEPTMNKIMFSFSVPNNYIFLDDLNCDIL